MKKINKSKNGRKYHIVLVTREHLRILKPRIQSYLMHSLPKLLEFFPGCEIIECNIDLTYIYLVMVIPSKYSENKVIVRIKKITNTELINKFTWLKGIWENEVIWWPGYLSSSKAVTEEAIQKYVRQKQERYYNRPIRIDLSEKDDYFNADDERIPDGQYLAELVDIKKEPYKNMHGEKLVWRWRIVEEGWEGYEITSSSSLVKGDSYRLPMHLKALSFRVIFGKPDLGILIGRKATLEIEQKDGIPRVQKVLYPYEFLRNRDGKR